MTYFPWGVMNGDVPDPDLLAQEYAEAYAQAAETTQLNWTDGAITDLGLLEGDGEHLVCLWHESSADTGLTDAHDHVLPDDAGADANLWKLPYSRGWSVVGAGATDGPVELEWESEYPELVEITADCQYVREQIGNFSASNWNAIRAMIGVEVDGVVQPGAIDATPIFNLHRGRGYGASALPFHQTYLLVLPPGAHTVRLVACIAPVTTFDDDERDAKTQLDDVLPTDRVCIGSRALWVTRYTRPALAEG